MVQKMRAGVQLYADIYSVPIKTMNSISHSFKFSNNILYF
jgi:hypothetical protein